jgi:hypothetical protein
LPTTSRTELLGHLHDGFGRRLALVEPGARIAQAVLHGELDLDDVLVFGQHGRFAQAGGTHDGVAAHVGGADLRGHHHFVALMGYGRRQLKPAFTVDL